MESNRIRQIYGYAVCLVAVVTALLSVSSLVNNALDLSDPVASTGRYDDAYASFEAYQASGRQLGPRTVDGEGAPVDTASEATHRARWEAMRDARVAQQRWFATKGVITSSALLLLAVGLFATHWRWLGRLS